MHPLSQDPTVADRPRKPRPTYADIEALPEHLTGEILNGELVVSPRPAPRHAVAASVLGAMLLPPYQHALGGPGGWWILDEPELSLAVDPDYDPVIPDLAGWRVGSMPELPETAQFTAVPDWVCEVLSPSTARLDRMEKLPFYGRAGVGHAWYVDPVLKTLEVFAQQGNGVWTLLHVVSAEDRIAVPPFDAIELELARLWGSPRRSEGQPDRHPQSS